MKCVWVCHLKEKVDPLWHEGQQKQTPWKGKINSRKSCALDAVNDNHDYFYWYWLVKNWKRNFSSLMYFNMNYESYNKNIAHGYRQIVKSCRYEVRFVVSCSCHSAWVISNLWNWYYCLCYAKEYPSSQIYFRWCLEALCFGNGSDSKHWLMLILL